jgi:2-hydroxychromene-2-carboxylate isomerase
LANPLEFDFYFSFRSPYSYLATPGIDALAAEFEVHPRIRIVLPIAVRMPGFFQKAHPQWLPYLVRDTVRTAEVNGIPFRWPRPDPIVQDRSSREVASEQPYIHHVSRMGAAAEKAGAGFAFVLHAAHMMWSGSVDNWHQGRHLIEAADRAGIDGEALDLAVRSQPDLYDSMIAENHAAQEGAGHWGVPLFVYDGEPFFGQDRIDHLVFRLKQNGLKARTS